MPHFLQGSEGLTKHPHGLLTFSESQGSESFAVVTSRSSELPPAHLASYLHKTNERDGIQGTQELVVQCIQYPSSLSQSVTAGMRPGPTRAHTGLATPGALSGLLSHDGDPVKKLGRRRMQAHLPKLAPYFWSTTPPGNDTLWHPDPNSQPLGCFTRQSSSLTLPSNFSSRT